ncbi:MAG TPA: hypothetical protein VF529_01155 [Solirubrobacteraceae bacterium]|jgi:hypothetical protein
MTDLAAPRFPDAQPGDGLYESYFLKAHHPDKPRAFWMRHTIHKRPDHDPIGSVWLTVFDADAKEPIKATKENFPAAELAPEGYVRIGESALTSDGAKGRVKGTTWDFTFATDEPEQRHLPNEWMYTAAVPRTKSLTPHPAARFEGKLGRHDLNGWTGVVSHNWGTEHAERWIYQHCCHFDGHDEHTWLEFVTGRVKLGPVTTPWIANGALQLDGTRHRLGGIDRARATKVEADAGAARFVLTGDGLRIEGALEAPKEHFVGWRYRAPDMDERHSLHSSIATLRLQIKRDGEPPVELSSDRAATYELGIRPGEPHEIPLQPHEDGRL